MGAQVFIAAKPWFLKRGLDGAGVRADVWRATRAQHTIISAQESTAPTTVAGPWPGEPGAVATAAGGEEAGAEGAEALARLLRQAFCLVGWPPRRRLAPAPRFRER